MVYAMLRASKYVLPITGRETAGEVIEVRMALMTVALIVALLAAVLVLAPGCGGGGDNPQVPFPGGVVSNPAGLTAADTATSATGWFMKIVLQGPEVAGVEVSYPDGSHFGSMAPPVEFAPNVVTSMGLTDFVLADLVPGGKWGYYTLIQNDQVWVWSVEANRTDNTLWRSAGPATGYLAAQVSGGKVVLTTDGAFVDKTVNLPDFS